MPNTYYASMPAVKLRGALAQDIPALFAGGPFSQITLNATLGPGLVANLAATGPMWVTASAGKGAGFEFAGAGNVPGTTSFFVGQAGSGNALLDQRANAPMVISTNSIAAITISATQTVSLSGSLGINGAAPPAQSTGWGTPTGASVANNFSGSAATLPQTSAAVAELIAILKAAGFLGT
jgi:hypothetical protein